MAMKVERSIGQARRGEGGFSLLEVLIANLMLAVGLLAIAAMQDVALSRNSDSKRLSVATSLVTEMLERIRYNSPANSTSPFPYTGMIACNFGCVPAPTSGSAPALSTALGDYTQWQNRLGATDAAGNLLLPNAIGTVTSALVPGGSASLGQVQVTVTVSWSSGVRTPTVTMNTIVAPL
jgi:type IV pilus assembly protein PilV